MRQLFTSDLVLKLIKESEYCPIERVSNTLLWNDHGIVNSDEKLKVVEQYSGEALKQLRVLRSRKRLFVGRIHLTRKVVKYCYSELLFCKRADIRRKHPRLSHVWLYELL